MYCVVDILSNAHFITNNTIVRSYVFPEKFDFNKDYCGGLKRHLSKVSNELNTLWVSH